MRRKAKSKKETFVVNSHQIAVKVWCASCLHKEITRNMLTRRCKKRRKDVKPSDCCQDWEMSEQLQRAGASQGVVRNIVTKEVMF